MKISELIEELKKYPSNTEVLCYDGCGPTCEYTQVEKIVSDFVYIRCKTINCVIAPLTFTGKTSRSKKNHYHRLELAVIFG